MKNQYLSLILLLLSSILLPAQSKLIGFSESGLINTENSGGMIWEMNPDGSGFKSLKNFTQEKKIQPGYSMVVGPDGKGYGFAKGFDFDGSTQVLYQYDFEQKSIKLLKTFSNAPWLYPLLIGPDGFIYGCQKVSATTQAVFKITLDGTSITLIHQYSCHGQTENMMWDQTGRLILTLSEYSEGVRIIAGFPDGSDWKQLAAFNSAQYGYGISNLAQKSDGSIYGFISKASGAVRLFRILPGEPSFTILYESTEAEIGTYLHIGLTANDVLNLVAYKNGGQFIYQMPSETSAPVLMHEAEGYGSHVTPLVNGENGDLYFLITKVAYGSQQVTMLKIKGNNTGVQIAWNIAFTVPYNQHLLSNLVLHPLSRQLYFWKIDEVNDISSLMHAQSDGTNIISDFATAPDVSEEGARPQKLIRASDGKLYGILKTGSLNQSGCIFRMNRNGTGFQVIYNFPAEPSTSNSWSPKRVVSFFEGSDGYLYGSKGDQRIFRLQKDGSEFGVLCTDLDFSCNFVEMPDGKLYWGGKNLTRMEKNGSDKTVLVSSFISPFTYYDQCMLYKLPNGNLAGAASYTFDECLDYYTTPFFLSVDWDGYQVNKNPDYRLNPLLTTMGHDGLIYFAKGAFNAQSRELTEYKIDCSTNTYITAAIHTNEGAIYGHIGFSPNAGNWSPIAWQAENGNCLMIKEWELGSMGYAGQFAFETTTISTATHQPVIREGASLSPNPTGGATQLSARLSTPGPVKILVLDLLGKLVFEQKTEAVEGENLFEIPGNALIHKGMYQVLLQSGTETYTQMLCVQ